MYYKNKKFLEVGDNFNIEEANKSYQFILLKLINQNRYQAVISKIGKLTKDNKNIVLDEYIEDVWNDFYQKYANIVINDWDKANEYVIKLTDNLINENLF